jgi:hypothetical protein
MELSEFIVILDFMRRSVHDRSLLPALRNAFRKAKLFVLDPVQEQIKETRNDGMVER